MLYTFFVEYDYGKKLSYNYSNKFNATTALMTRCLDQVQINFASRLSTIYANGTWKVLGNTIFVQMPKLRPSHKTGILTRHWRRHKKWGWKEILLIWIMILLNCHPFWAVFFFFFLFKQKRLEAAIKKDWNFSWLPIT